MITREEAIALYNQYEERHQSIIKSRTHAIMRDTISPSIRQVAELGYKGYVYHQENLDTEVLTAIASELVKLGYNVKQSDECIYIQWVK